VRRPSPKVLAAVGALTAVVGAILAMVFAVVQTNCQDGPGGLLPNPALASSCTGLAWGARIGFVVLVSGALLIMIAGITTTARFSPPPAGQTGAEPTEHLGP
jgi:hypothetical protein